MTHDLQTVATAFLLAEARRYLARSLEGYRRAFVTDASNGGECCIGYDDAYDELGRCTDASLAAASAIVASDPVAWHRAILASESAGDVICPRTGAAIGPVGVETMARVLGACIAYGETLPDEDTPHCAPLLASEAAARWRAVVAADEAAEQARYRERIAKENEEN